MFSLFGFSKKRQQPSEGQTGYGYLGPSAVVKEGTHISNPANLEIGENSIVYENCHILCDQGKLIMGNNSHLAATCYINAVKGTVKIGDNVAVGPKTMIFSHSNHYEPGKLVTQTYRTADVEIGNNVLIGAGAIILPGITIGDNAVVGAGSVVTKNVAAHTVVAGNPAQEIKDRSF